MRDLAERNKILEIVSGSHLYGTNTKTSDRDFVGVFIAPEKYYLGLQSVDEVDCSTISKLENGKNDPDAIDKKFYELRKFMKLAMENNPNILEILFSPIAIFNNLYGQYLFDRAEIFPWKGAAQKFLGYAFSQKHKMQIKTGNYFELHEANDWFIQQLEINSNGLPNLQGREHKRLLAEFRETAPKSFKFEVHHVGIGDLNISIKDNLYKAYQKISERISKVGNREDLYTKYGYDTKFGMHLVRLMFEGKELLETGRIQFPLKEKELLLDIRNGKWKVEEVLKFSEELEKEVESLKETTKLPSKPRFDEIEIMLISMVKNYHIKVN